MLDKSQIKDWDGKPEEAAKAVASATAPPSQNKDIAAAIMGAREAIPTGERVILTPEQATARKRRGQWLAIALFAFVIVVFVLTMNKVGGGLGVPQVYHMDGAQ